MLGHADKYYQLRVARIWSNYQNQSLVRLIEGHHRHAEDWSSEYNQKFRKCVRVSASTSGLRERNFGYVVKC